ncbi:pyridoxal phosphate-dependent aminotransferase [Collimonas humicola]|uniref:pyridoxal phosphate-dependent aminotransferase n=1 Tax=Collimonas humicola TaxID=2825886 RepID=UPI001B8CFC76|nr:histidinol-phosphate transaminase [Collimonas humicola]
MKGLESASGTHRPGKLIGLAYNENPEAVASGVKQGIGSALESVNRYPFATEIRVMQKLAGHFGHPQENLMLVRGIDECFDRISAEFSSMRFVTAWPGFDGYRGRIKVNRLTHFEIGLDADLALRQEDLEQVTKNDFVVLANPSNPTGLALRAEQLDLLQQRAGKLLIDETYVDYSSFRDRGLEYGSDRLIFRSFSKSYGLAGLRLGVVFGEAAIIAAMKQRQWFCNVGVLDLHALEAAIENDHVREAHIRTTLHERRRVELALRDLGYRVAPSEANFVLLGHEQVEAAAHFLALRGILVKDASQFGLGKHIRISIGSAADNSRLIAVLAEYSNIHKVI